MSCRKLVGKVALLLVTSLSCGQAVAQSTLAGRQSINCTIKPLKEIKVSVPIPGHVAQVLVKPGSVVKKGDVLVRLDSDVARADLALAQQKASFNAPLKAAEAQSAALSKRVERLRVALSRKSISVSEYEDALLQRDLAKSSVARERHNLALAKFEADRARILVEKSEVTSPMDGVIGEDLVHQSESITNQPVATLFVTSALRSEAFVPVSVSHLLREGRPYKFVVNGRQLPNKSVKLDYFSPTVNLSSNTISVYFIIQDASVLPGLKCALNLL